VITANHKRETIDKKLKTLIQTINNKQKNKTPRITLLWNSKTKWNGVNLTHELMLGHAKK